MKARPYTTADITSIAHQLQRVTIDGERVFSPVIGTNTLGKHHVIYLDTGLSIPVLEFLKRGGEHADDRGGSGMSTVKTYLVIVYILTGDMIRATAYFAEEDTRRELEEVFLFGPAERKEIHVAYELLEPLDEMQLLKLGYLKDMGIISGFHVKDEISSEIVELNEKTGIDVEDKQQVRLFWTEGAGKPTYREMMKKLREMADKLKRPGDE